LHVSILSVGDPSQPNTKVLKHLIEALLNSKINSLSIS